MNILHRVIIIILFLVSFLTAMAQEIELKYFRRELFPPNYYINRDIAEGCAVVFLYSNKTLKVETNMGVIMKDVDNEGVVIYYIPAGTTSIRISYNDYHFLNYDFPKPLEANRIYSVNAYVPKSIADIVTTHSYNSSDVVDSHDILITNFRRSPQGLIASMMPEYDNLGQACAVIRYAVDNEDFIIEPNLGVVKTKKEKPGEIIQYVPKGTKRLTVRNGFYMPVRDYEIPVEIESKATYDVMLSLSENAIRRVKASPDHDNYLGIGYNNPRLLFNSDGGTRQLTIHCNTSWDISAPSWCKLSKNTGAGVMEIVVTAKNNSTGQRRHGVIGIQSQDITITIVVEQEGK